MGTHWMLWSECNYVPLVIDIFPNLGKTEMELFSSKWRIVQKLERNIKYRYTFRYV
jgi:hypothetical protein